MEIKENLIQQEKIYLTYTAFVKYFENGNESLQTQLLDDINDEVYATGMFRGETSALIHAENFSKEFDYDLHLGELTEVQKLITNFCKKEKNKGKLSSKLTKYINKQIGDLLK